LVSDFKKFDTENDWTYEFSDDDLREISEDVISYSRFMTDHLMKYGFAIYDTSNDREQVLDQILEYIKAKEA
jgi:hypothetical protein